MTATLTCSICGVKRVIASGYIALAMTPEKRRNIADRIGWHLTPDICPECWEESDQGITNYERKRL